jgi:hypothetical protein
MTLSHLTCHKILLYHYTVAAQPRWEPETIACEPETVNRKGSSGNKKLGSLKNWR